MRVWIDLANSPHPMLFEPIGRRLRDRGHELVLTTRDHAQTVELTNARFGPGVEVIGGESPGGRRAKAAAIAGRVRALARWAKAARPDVALSHNSYAQIVAARMRGIAAVTAMDFEHQPSNHLAFRLAHTVILPDALRGAPLRRKGATARKTRFYDGLKEELYLGEFEPDPGVLAELGIERGPDTVVVVARTPPSRAIYHQFGNPLLLEALRTLGELPDVRCVVLTRHPEQRAELEALALPSLVLPGRAVDSRALMWEADLVLGAGGTMTREAALLGARTFTLFAGAVPAVDRRLEQRGLLRRLESVEELLPLAPRPAADRDLEALRRRGARLVDELVDWVEQSGPPVAARGAVTAGAPGRAAG